MPLPRELLSVWASFSEEQIQAAGEEAWGYYSKTVKPQLRARLQDALSKEKMEGVAPAEKAQRNAERLNPRGRGANP
ncbi:MAG: hypothetical protein V1909_03865 [Candidatus Micrarchaeota archaeon]